MPTKNIQTDKIYSCDGILYQASFVPYDIILPISFEDKSYPLAFLTYFGLDMLNIVRGSDSEMYSFNFLENLDTNKMKETKKYENEEDGFEEVHIYII